MKTEIYVMTHKPCAIPDIPGYVRMQVGAALHDDLGYLRDDEGDDHISDLNPYYAELTGVYRLWRCPTGADIVGVCHYRRYFINEEQKILSMPEYESLLADADVVAAVSQNELECLDLFSSVHNKEDMLAIGRAIRDIYPADHPAFEEMLHARRSTYGNLLVMRRNVFGEYCEWLFSVLAEASEYMDLSGYDDYHRKVLGILGEGLLWVYVRARGLRMRECKAAFFGEKAETRELKEALRVLLREEKVSEALELHRGVLRQRPDLSSPESDFSGDLAVAEGLLLRLEQEAVTGEPGLFSQSHELSELLALYRAETR